MIQNAMAIMISYFSIDHRSLNHTLIGKDLSVSLVLEEGAVGIAKVDAGSLDALSKFWGLEALAHAGAVVEASQEGFVDCCFVVVNSLGADRH